MAGRFGACLVALVGTGLDQLHVVVGEGPEPGFGAFQGPGVVEAIEGPGGLVDEVCEAFQHGAVQRIRDCRRVDGQRGRLTGSEAEDETAGVQDLDGETPADLHLAVIEGCVGSGPAVRRPVAHGVRAVLVQQVQRGDHVALGFGHLLAVRVQDPTAQGAVGPRCRVGLEVGAHGCREQPRPDDVMCLGAQVHGVGAGVEVLVLFPAAGDLRGERRGGPGVHDVAVADESARLTAPGLVVAGGGVRRRVDGQVGFGGDDGCVVYGFAVCVQRVPEGQRHTEEPLPADQPVAVQAVDPVGVPGLHVGGMPGDLVAAGDEVGP